MLSSTFDELKEAFYAMRNSSYYGTDDYGCSEDDSFDDDDADCCCD